MGVPKRKTSKSRRDKRRHQQRLAVPSLSLCPHCGARQLPHHVCQSCGFYKEREVLVVHEM